MSTPAQRQRRSGLLSRWPGRNNEGYLAALLLLVVAVMSAAAPAFFSLHTFFSVIRGATVPWIFAMGVLLVLVSGGIDVSFPAIAVFSAYSAVALTTARGVDAGLLGNFALAMAIGCVLGLVNGILIARFRLPTLIVTLGTAGFFRGAMITFVGATYIAQLPRSLAEQSTRSVISVNTEAGTTFLHVLVVPVLILTVLIALGLKHTMFGRAAYAIGGDPEAARRVGIPVQRTQVVLYVLVGALAAFGGMVFMIQGQAADPQMLIGIELDTIAAVVLGGASIFGGRGSVLGTVLGVLLVQVINNSLVLVGVPTAWQRATVGLLLLLGVGAQAWAGRRPRRVAPAAVKAPAVKAAA
ncbi:MAG TPA: ABC transporter permease [Propionibacteriaceae bacterium]|jgi:simple sugar transport system permease protein|nr:ABC transporter permease [Propionibacteriaceae bacterium]HBY22043.1 ABC transporter permease [Propionibacteriaceae bacterium]